METSRMKKRRARKETRLGYLVHRVSEWMLVRKCTKGEECQRAEGPHSHHLTRLGYRRYIGPRTRES